MTVQTFGDVSRDSSNDPIGSVYTPGTANNDLTPMQGGPRSTDANGKTSAPAAISGSFVELAALTVGALNADLIPSTDVSAYKSVGLQITGTWVGTLTVQGSNDTVNFQSVNAFSMASFLLSSTYTANDFILIPVSFRYLRVRMTAYTSGTANGVAEQYALPHPFFLYAAQLGTWQVSPAAGKPATYTYAISATAPYATPTDWIVVRGSATKTGKITRIEISGAATAATEVIFTLKKHTIANTLGTSTTPTPMKHDSNDGAPTTTILLYSVAPTIDASATIWKTVRMTLAVAPAATANNPDRYVYDVASNPSEPLVLRGIAQEFALNFAGAAVPAGGVYDVAITITEDNS